MDEKRQATSDHTDPPELALRILMLEDSEFDAELILHEMHQLKMPFTTRRVESREAFSEALRSFMPDLILADYSLPAFDGLSAFEMVRETRAELPFIFVSGAIGEELAIDLLKRGATDFVLKNRLSLLVPAVQRALIESDERRMRRKAEEERDLLLGELESRVQERTKALQESEDALRQTNESLEQRVRERTMDLQNLTEQLERSRDELRNLASELVMAEERERKRVAGVLHDEVAQTLAAARMKLDLLKDIPSDQRDRTLGEAKALLVQSIQETRELMNDLGNPLLFEVGLQAACDALANRLMERHPVRIRCDIRDAFKHLIPDVKIILYQVFRELLNNVVKHSKAQNARVMIDLENGHFRLKVTDDGVGFDPQMLGAPTVEGGFGLYSIRERLIAIGGSLMIESTPGTGTVVTAILPAALD